MSLHAVNIQGINITNSSKKEILEVLRKFLIDGAWNGQKSSKNSRKTITIVTPNPEQLVLAKNNLAFSEVLNQADVAIPDGIGLVWASRILSSFRISNFEFRISHTIPGVDFMEELVGIAAKQHVPIALIGGKSKVAVSAFECLRQNHPDLLGVALDAPDFMITASGLSMNGSIDEYFKKLSETLGLEKIGVIFVALGAPKQEFFMERIRDSLTEKEQARIAIIDSRLAVSRIILMSVGGAFDEISGRIPRAPGWVSRVGMKWLWRLMLEPWRIKRQFALLMFVVSVLKERLFIRVK